MTEHNHVTRDIKPIGQCPACDRYHDQHIPKPEKIGERAHLPITEIDRAFGEWLSQVGHNRSFSLKTAFEAGARLNTDKLNQAIKALEIIRDSNHGKDCDLHADQVASIVLNKLAESDKHSVQVLNE